MTPSKVAVVSLFTVTTLAFAGSAAAAEEIPDPETTLPGAVADDPPVPDVDVPEVPGLDGVPELPVPEVPGLDGVPELPVPEVPGLDGVPELPVPEVPGLDGVPELPDLGVGEVTDTVGGILGGGLLP